MERNDLTTLVSHYIPNESVYLFDFPLRILNKYNGANNLDDNIDDNLIYFITKPLIDNQIEYNLHFEWNANHTNNWYHSLIIHLRVNDNKFDINLIIKNIAINNMIEGLTITKRFKYNQSKTFYKNQ